MPRPPVTGARLEEFLRRSGRDFHGTGRLYLVGGAQMVQAGLRRQTQDIGYTVRLDAVYQEPFSLALLDTLWKGDHHLQRLLGSRTQNSSGNFGRRAESLTTTSPLCPIFLWNAPAVGA